MRAIPHRRKSFAIALSLALALALGVVLAPGFGTPAEAGALDGQWQGSSPQARAPSGGGFCSLGYFLDVRDTKLSGIVQTAKGELKFETTIKTDGSFTYTARDASGNATSGSGKFSADKFEATQSTPCGSLTAKGVHIG